MNPITHKTSSAFRHPPSLAYVTKKGNGQQNHHRMLVLQGLKIMITFLKKPDLLPPTHRHHSVFATFSLSETLGKLNNVHTVVCHWVSPGFWALTFGPTKW